MWYLATPSLRACWKVNGKIGLLSLAASGLITSDAVRAGHDIQLLIGATPYEAVN
jgi:hypothetical protein